MSGQALRRCSSRSSATRNRSERFSPSARALSMRANVPSGNRAAMLSKFTCLRPTRRGVADISFAVNPSTFLISPIDAQSDIFYLVDIRFGGKAMLNDKQYAEKTALERKNMLGVLSDAENKRYVALLTQERAPKPVEPLAGHKCLGARTAVEVCCECGWVSLPFSGQDARAQAYSDWRAHVTTKHAKELRYAG